MSSNITEIRGELVDWGGSGWRNVAHPLGGVKLDGATNDRAAWAALDAAYGYDVPVGVSVIGSNLTISVKMLRPAPGAKLKPSSGVVVTIDCPVENVRTDFFDTSAGGSFVLSANAVVPVIGTGTVTLAAQVAFTVGSVGIGTATPTMGQLHISGNSSSGPAPNRPRLGFEDLAGVGKWTFQPWITSGDDNFQIARNGGTGYFQIGAPVTIIGKTTMTDGTALDATYDLSAASILGLDSRVANATTTGHYIGAHFVALQTVATTGSIQGLENFTYVKHTSGTVAAAFGMISNQLINAPGGTLTNMYGRGGGLVMVAGTLGTYYNLACGGATIIGGTIADQYALYIGAVSGASAANWSIYGTSGNVSFRITALATNATTGHLFIPSCAGAPTGVPAIIPTDQVALQYDSTNHKLYAYRGAWRATAALA